MFFAFLPLYFNIILNDNDYHRTLILPLNDNDYQYLRTNVLPLNDNHYQHHQTNVLLINGITERLFWV